MKPMWTLCIENLNKGEELPDKGYAVTEQTSADYDGKDLYIHVPILRDSLADEPIATAHLKIYNVTFDYLHFPFSQENCVQLGKIATDCMNKRLFDPGCKLVHMTFHANSVEEAETNVRLNFD